MHVHGLQDQEGGVVLKRKTGLLPFGDYIARQSVIAGMLG